MRSLKPLALVVVLSVVFLYARPARAQSSGCSFADPSCSAGLTTFLLVVGVPVTVTVLVAALTWNVTSAPGPAYRHAALIYLQQNHNELQQDLAEGQGPMVADLATTLELPADHVARFGELLRSHRAQLRDLVDPPRLNEDRAVAFFRTVVQLASADPTLSPDLALVRQHHPLPI